MGGRAVWRCITFAPVIGALVWYTSEFQPLRPGRMACFVRTGCGSTLRCRPLQAVRLGSPGNARPVKESALAEVSESSSPLRRAMQRPSFPKGLPINPILAKLGCCVHIPGLVCPQDDPRLAAELLADIEKGQKLIVHRSGRHHQVFGEDLMSSRLFSSVVGRLLSTFNLSLIDCWVNAYKHSQEVKSMHHDNYADRSPRPTVTIGLSLGQARDIVFEHKATGRRYPVLQQNGDVFAFDSDFNRQCSHGIPSGGRDQDGLRLSIIIWAGEKTGTDLAVPVLMRKRLPGAAPERIEWKGWDLTSELQF